MAIELKASEHHVPFCDDENCNYRAVGYIPFPTGSKNCIDGETNRYLCERHIERAIEQRFYVRRFDETEGQSTARFDALINEAHFRLRKQKIAA